MADLESDAVSPCRSTRYNSAPATSSKWRDTPNNKQCRRAKRSTSRNSPRWAGIFRARAACS